jgi:hypothetical protein
VPTSTQPSPPDQPPVATDETATPPITTNETAAPTGTTDAAPPRQPTTAWVKASLADKRAYIDLHGERMMALLEEAAARRKDRGLEEEIGALRIVLARVLAGEDDLHRLAMNVARIAQANVHAVRAHHDLASQARTLQEFQAMLDGIATDSGAKP